MTPAPIVSVLMPAFNHERFVAQAVESVWAQTFGQIELVAIDDGSSDRTAEILRDLAQRSPMPMRVEVQLNEGVSATLNRALAMARGEWVCLLASDDYYHPQFVARNLQVARQHGRHDVVQHCDGILVEPGGRPSGTIGDVSPLPPLRGKGFDQVVYARGRLLPCSMFLPRSLLQSVGAFDPTMVAEDFDVQLRLARAAEFDFIDEALVYSRYSPGSLGRQPWRFAESILAALQKHEDLLGSRLPLLLRDRCIQLARGCLEHGRFDKGLHWFRRALVYSKSADTLWRIATGLAYGLARALAIRAVGRHRLVQLKRRLTTRRFGLFR